MAQPTRSAATADDTVRVMDGGFRLVLVVAGLCAVLIGLSILGGAPSPHRAGSAGASSFSPTASPLASVDPTGFIARDPVAASPIDLTDQDGQPFSLASLRGSPVFVFFGYSHCEDVCPATIGTVGKVLETTDVGARAVFVSIDPERDTPAWLKEYLTYLRSGFIALTGSADQVHATATAWGVHYARVDTGKAGGYSMSHTTDVFLVDSAGTLRATFPYGTDQQTMAAALRTVAVGSGRPPGPTATPTSTTIAPLTSGASPGGATGLSPASLEITIVSSSVWSGPAGPLILSLSTGGIRLDDIGLRPTVRLVSTSGEPVGSPVEAVPVQPPGVPAVSYVATMAIPEPGLWQLAVTVPLGAREARGTVEVTALDPGATAPLGVAAPTVHTPTLADVGGLAKAITTDPAPDLRLSQRSTTDALADRQPFVLVVDSTKFRVSPACGRAIILARYLLDRWLQVGFIHLEPYRYSVITSTPVLDGSLADPTLTDPAAAWGIGGAPWGARSMPWVFVVDGSGVVRAKYQGVVGSDDVDVIVALIAQGG